MINRESFCKLGIKNVTPHLKMSQDDSDEGSQHMILMRHKKAYQILPLI